MALPAAHVTDADAQLNFEWLARYVYVGVGVPTVTPASRAIYIRLDGGTSTTLYVYEGAAWVAK